MRDEESYNQKLARAEKRVRDIKKFYKHLRVFVIANILLFTFKFKAFEFFTEQGISDDNFINWFNWNIIGTPVVWGVILALHAVYVFVLKSKPLKEFTPKFFKSWEERQIEKFMKEEDN